MFHAHCCLFPIIYLNLNEEFMSIDSKKIKTLPVLSGTLWNLGSSGFYHGEENYHYTDEQWRN